MTSVWTGRCLCSAVRYEAIGDPLFQVLCHCRTCQRASGAAGVPAVGVPRAALMFSGPVTSHTWEPCPGSGRAIARIRCQRCGSLLGAQPERFQDLTIIYAGSLDDPDRFEPEAAQHVASRPDWVASCDGLPEFSGDMP